MIFLTRLFKVLSALGGFLGQTLNKVLLRSQRALSICALFYRILIATFSGPACWRIMFQELAKQVYFTAIQGVHVPVFSALILGLVVIVHATQQLVKIQGEEFVGWLLVTIVVREVGPVWAAFFVLIRSGSAITVEIGTMSVTGEVEALKMMGVDPYRYLGVPRFWGLIFSLMAMYVLCMFSAVIGGWAFPLYSC
jgi:phospholipid/cholesterol/gamma-HCH transport system permease protein